MIVANSLRQLGRTPVKTLAFLILLVLAVAFFMLGFQLWSSARDSIERINNAYTTIGTVEQKGTVMKTAKIWDAMTKQFTYFTYAGYDGIVPVSVLDFEGAEYILKPEQRPCYGAYMPGFVMSSHPYWDVVYDDMLLILELQPVEDCETGDPILMKVKRVVAGGLEDYIDEIWFCDHNNPTPVQFKADKTYIMSLQAEYFHGLENGLTYMPSTGVSSTQMDKNGEPVTGALGYPKEWEEMSGDFYNTQRGRYWMTLVESLEWLKYTVPVMPTQGTKLIMRFYEGDAWISAGRDISSDEYQAGDKVCLVPQAFADNNGLSVGDSLRLPLYVADYARAPVYAIRSGILNADGEIYPIFEDSAYTIVGVYQTLQSDTMEISHYDLPDNAIVIPSASVKKSDENNIMMMGPMKGYTTSFQIPNGQIGAFTQAWERQGISSLEINFYDGGYTKIKAGLDDMISTATMLLIAGAATTLLVLILFCHLFIAKQKKRTAIERSLGVRRRGCMASLLTGIMVIVIPACVIGYAVSGWLAGWAAEQIEQTRVERVYSTAYSDWVNNADAEQEEDLAISYDTDVRRMLVGVWVIPAALAIALINIRSNLKSEPLKLLGERVK